MSRSQEEICKGKKPYYSRAKAKAARRRVMGRRRAEGKDGPLSIYVCPVCTFLHLGHLPRAVRDGTWDKDDYTNGRSL